MNDFYKLFWVSVIIFAVFIWLDSGNLYKIFTRTVVFAFLIILVNGIITREKGS